MFEKKWHIQISEQVLKVVDPKHNILQIQLEDIQRIAIQTNDSGPLGIDVLWRISDDKSQISFPLGVAGEADVLKIFQEFDGFDHLELINAMSSTENAVFILFEKTKVQNG